ncbi:MAG: hypothetical protein QM758_12165 [Armatimonas sp.]
MKLALSTLFLLVFSIAPTWAQKENDWRWRVQAGIGIPSSSDGGGFLGSRPLSLGGSYDIGRVAKGKWGVFYDGVVRENRYVAVSTIGLGAQIRLPAGNSFYYGGGIGRFRAGHTRLGSVSDSSESYLTGQRVFVGSERGRYFAELGYLFLERILVTHSGESGGFLVEPGSFSARLGIRF